MAVEVVLCGVGGYGSAHLQVMRPAMEQGRMRLVGGVDPFVERAPDKADLAARGIPVWRDLDGLRASGVRPELMVLASPIHFHCEQTCAALEMGANVLCEKPVAATLNEVAQMTEARDRARKLVAVGYQWSFSSAVQNLKRDIQQGRYGRATRLRTWVAWPRHSGYYERNTWAGKIYDAQGRPVFDSPVNNATAHYLHHMLYVLGTDGPDSAAQPVSLTAELYRANRIENFDAACMRIQTADGVEVLFYAAHCVAQGNRPTFIFEFERGTVASSGDTFRGTLADGTTVDYGRPDTDAMQRKLDDTLAAVRQGSTQTVCGIETAAMHTRVVSALQRLPIHTFAAALRQTQTLEDGAVLTSVPGLFEAMRAGFEQGYLFSEMGMPWALPAVEQPLDEEPASNRVPTQEAEDAP